MFVSGIGDWTRLVCGRVSYVEEGRQFETKNVKEHLVCSYFLQIRKEIKVWRKEMAGEDGQSRM